MCPGNLNTSAVLSGIARGARSGVLLKGGGPLEKLASIDVIAFDKTGTLTEGEPKLTDVETIDSHTVDDLLIVAIAVERLSNHPLAKAVVRDGVARLSQKTETRIPTATDVRVYPEKAYKPRSKVRLFKLERKHCSLTASLPS